MELNSQAALSSIEELLSPQGASDAPSKTFKELQESFEKVTGEIQNLRNSKRSPQRVSKICKMTFNELWESFEAAKDRAEKGKLGLNELKVKWGQFDKTKLTFFGAPL